MKKTNNADTKNIGDFCGVTENKKDLNRTTEKTQPTKEAYEQLEYAFDFLNIKLFEPTFGVKLPRVMFDLSVTNHYMACFIPNIWTKANDHKSLSSAISINLMKLHSLEEIIQTEAHEMVHLGQELFPDQFGKPCKGGHHGKSFLKSMVMIGLMPSSTGQPGGKTTGYSMSDYIIKDGPIDRVIKELKDIGFSFSWFAQLQMNKGTSHETEGDQTELVDKDKERKRRSKTKYTCDNCQLKAWAKPCIRLTCGECNVRMIEDIDNNFAF